MNLRKATKSQLIKEVQRLRPFEDEARKLRLEIQRRDRATDWYRKLEKPAIEWATVIAQRTTPKEIDEAWESYWTTVQDMRMDEFWAERCADKIEEYSEYIKDVLNDLMITKTN